MEKIDTREPELSHRCETERVLKEKVHRFCRVDFVDYAPIGFELDR